VFLKCNKEKKVDKNKTVLLVDDDKEYINSLEELLTSVGYKVLIAHNGKEALAHTEKTRPDAIILDVMMDSDTEGFEVSRVISKTEALNGLPVILVTGISREMNLPFRFEPHKELLPVRAVIDKPVDPSDLLKKLEELW